jgi:hypothetical protein
MLANLEIRIQLELVLDIRLRLGIPKDMLSLVWLRLTRAKLEDIHHRHRHQVPWLGLQTLVAHR